MRTGLRDKKLNNAGLSLVELVVVIAIMAVFAGASISIVVAINNAKTKSCAQSIYSDISRVKANTLAKQKDVANPFFFELTKNAGGEYIVREVVENGITPVEKVVGVKDLTVTYSLDQNATSGGTPVSATSTAKCQYDRSDGSVVESETNFKTILVSGARASYAIRLYYATGKVKMERIK